MTKETMTWDTSLYNRKHDFVFKFGEELVHLLQPQPGERIVDLGCGTGYLTSMLAEAGAEVTGIDNSVQMVEKAKAEYPGIDFKVMSATDFHFDEPFDAIFSNAVLHWVTDKEKAAGCMYDTLKSGGRLVAEFGGKDNVKQIVDALRQTLSKFGYAEKATLQMWYFPSIAEYTSILEKKGFTVNYASYFNRDTELKDNSNGIKDWIKMFGSSFLKGINDNDIDRILTEVQQMLQATNYHGNKWLADYKRLRIVATKP